MGLPLTGILQTGLEIIKKVIPDKQAQAEASYKLLELHQRGELAEMEADVKLATAQTEINKVEAASPSLFVAGWRPAMGWCCVAIFAANYIGAPLLAWLSPLLEIPPPPRLDIGEVLPVLLGMLGLGTLRTTEFLKTGVKAK
jgi:hypothetical protein